MRLQAGVAEPRYLELLSGHDLSNVLVVYGQADRLVGALDTAEVQFLRNHGARVLALAGGHRSMFESNFHEALAGALFKP